MKDKLLLALVVLFVSLQSFSQKKHEFRLYYGNSASEFLRNEDLDGAGGNNIENFNEFGLKYLRLTARNLSFETGINYLKMKDNIDPAYTGTPVESRFETVEMISVPLYFNYSFVKYLFINGGPVLDFQISDNSTDSQSGIGYSLGLGGKYYFKDFVVFVNPNFKRHSVIPFAKENYQQRLTEVGIQMGLGYTF